VDGSVSNHAVLWRDGQVIDLGEGRALGINNRDQVVGIAAVDGRNRAFRWENGRRTLLETPDGAVSSAVAINDRGDVVGEISAPVSAPVRWRNGHLQHLPVPAPGVAAAATDMNELGQVLITTSEDVANKGYLLTGSRLRPLGVPAGEVGILPAALNDRGDVAALGSSGGGPLLWRDGRFTALPTAGFGFAQAHDLNNRDVVVGGGNSTATNTFQALLWS
jgi:probable HAF family extracellular repeat protein